MVQRLRQTLVVRLVLRFRAWLLHCCQLWLAWLVRWALRPLTVFQRMVLLSIRPRNPNNLFLVPNEASDEVREAPAPPAAEPVVDGQGVLLWRRKEAKAPATLDTVSFSLWRGEQAEKAETAQSAAVQVNRQFAFEELLATQLDRLTKHEIEQLDTLIERLTTRWLDVEETYEDVPRRNRLAVGETLRYNIPRYGGRILQLRHATRELPVPRMAKPARILLIGDVSHSMIRYMMVPLYFMHKLNFRFTIDSYVFSQKATHVSPFLNGAGTFEEKSRRLVAGAHSWNAGTRFGSALEEIAKTAMVDENTYVVIATDGKVSLKGAEGDKIRKHLTSLRRKAKSVLFLTPTAEFAGNGKAAPHTVGRFQTGFDVIPIFEASPSLWYGVLGEYADRIYLVRTVRDLVNLTDDLVRSSYAM
ncbi:MAG: VWA domain-containing protein [Mycobacterium leprae]